MGPNVQELLAFVIVGVSAGWLGQLFFRKRLAEPVSRLLLRRGRVKLAHRVRVAGMSEGCGGCAPAQSRCGG